MITLHKNIAFNGELYQATKPKQNTTKEQDIAVMDHLEGYINAMKLNSKGAENILYYIDSNGRKITLLPFQEAASSTRFIGIVVNSGDQTLCINSSSTDENINFWQKVSGLAAKLQNRLDTLLNPAEESKVVNTAVNPTNSSSPDLTGFLG